MPLHISTRALAGRSKGPKGRVPDQIVSAWASSLAGPDAAIVFLFGRKQGQKGSSEFSYFSFGSGFDTCLGPEVQPSLQSGLTHSMSSSGF